MRTSCSAEATGERPRLCMTARSCAPWSRRPRGRGPGPRNTIPALPLCHVQFRGRRPLSPAYPKEIHTIGDHLRRRRLALGLGQPEVARQLRVKTCTITNWELGHTRPALRWLPRVVAFLGYDPRPDSATVGEALVRHRKGQGLSQRELAAILSVDPSTLAKWEREDRIPAGRFAERVRQLLGGGASIERAGLIAARGSGNAGTTVGTIAADARGVVP